MLAMSRALASDPALLILDELSMGLAPLIVDELYETVVPDRRVRRLHPVHRAVRPHRAAGRRLRRRDERRPGGRHRRARRDPRDHVRRHPGRGGMKPSTSSRSWQRGWRPRRCRSPPVPRRADETPPTPHGCRTAATAAAASPRRSRSRSSSPPSRSRRSPRPSSTSATPGSRRTPAAPRAGPASCGPATASARGSRPSSPSSACRPRLVENGYPVQVNSLYPSDTTKQQNAPFPGTSMTATSGKGSARATVGLLHRLQRR